MKTLYLIGGPMGVGKTTAGQRLKRLLDNAVFLDGDWCWDMDPFQVTSQTKTMVLNNICALLRNFLSCPVLDNIVFCWVLHEQAILDAIVSQLPLEGCRVLSVSLVCREAFLRQRLERDIALGLRTADVVERSVARLPLYQAMDTILLDTSGCTPEEVARRLAAL